MSVAANFFLLRRGAKLFYSNYNIMLRSIYYVLMAALEDKETQHEKLFSLLFPLVAQRFEKQARIRLRVHYGSYIEISYNLMTFGIPVTDFPMIDDLTDIKRQKHQKWITTRRNLELKRKQGKLAQQDTSSGSTGTSTTSANNNNKNTTTKGEAAVNITDGATLLPSHSDILFGRGKPVQEHPGNLALNVLVENRAPEYAKCKGKKQKMDLTQSIVLDIKSKGGRFIKQMDNHSGSGIWVEVDDETARSKVSHTFRNIKMQLVQQNKQQQQGGGGEKRQRPI